eukprot:566442-Pelagomonas_calceolata.AAC.7
MHTTALAWAFRACFHPTPPASLTALELALNACPAANAQSYASMCDESTCPSTCCAGLRAPGLQ